MSVLDRVRRGITLRKERFPSDRDILDIGCGDYKRGTVGLDLFDGPEVDVVGDALDLPFEDDRFDSVICYHLVEHLDREEFTLLLANIERVLKRGGRVHLLVDRDESEEELLLKDPTHVRRYAPETVRERCESYFDIEVFQSHNLVGNVHNHPFRWPVLLFRGTKVYVEGVKRE